MQNKIIIKLSDEIREKTNNAGGIQEFVKSEENKGTIVNWLELVKDISALFDENKGFEMEIGRQKYHNCYFKVGTYSANSKAMFIGVYGIKDKSVDTEEYFIDTVTVYNSKTDYNNKRITVKEEFVPILRNLGIINEETRCIFTMQECRDTMDYADRNYANCTINDDMLKRFCKDWNYQYE